MIGVANLFADLTYEGARSVTGPFMAQLGASAATVSIVSGFGEFVGYTLRAVAGSIADRTGRYWTITFVGYAINMLAVPALALAGNWPLAAGLIVGERTGRAIRRPVVQGMISHARRERRLPFWLRRLVNHRAPLPGYAHCHATDLSEPAKV